jgi:hypothetical protein
MARYTKTLNVLGDELEIIWDGNVWVSPATHRSHASAWDAMREELEEYIRQSGDDADDDLIDGLMSYFEDQ